MACQTIDTVICGRPYRNIPFLLRRAKHNALPAAAFFLQKYINAKDAKKYAYNFAEVQRFLHRDVWQIPNGCSFRNKRVRKNKKEKENLIKMRFCAVLFAEKVAKAYDKGQGA